EHFQNIPETHKKINGHAFLKTNKEDFERYGLKAGLATTG
ncbi:5821_t:CDS:1, partial [Funneliformis caledonium]